MDTHQLGQYLNAVLVFFAVLAAAVTLYSGVFASAVIWPGDTGEMADPVDSGQLGHAVDFGVGYAFVRAAPLAVGLAYLRAMGVDFG